MRMIWRGDPCVHPATGLFITKGEADYPAEHVETLLVLGLKPVEADAPAPRRKTKGEEE